MNFLLIFVFVLFSFTAQAAGLEHTRQLLTEAKEPVRIVCMGDSITGVYYHSGGRRAYPEMLGLALQKIYPAANIMVQNAGISGDTTQGGLARLQRDVLTHKPHLVTIMFGMNDLVRIAPDAFVANLRQIVQRCRGAGAEVLLCTQNSIVDSATRPSQKLVQFSEMIRALAKAEGVPAADCHAAFDTVRARDDLEWSLLLSDAIHPNMAGHKLFAETLAQAISEKPVSLSDVGPPLPALQHTFRQVTAGKPIRVLAMPPYDALISGALKAVAPTANVSVETWPTEGKTLADLENSAKRVRSIKPDLVILAVPGHNPVDRPKDFHQHYAWIMNWSLSFGPQEWDVLVAPPSTALPQSAESQKAHERFARRLIGAQDLVLIERAKDDASSLSELLSKWISTHWRQP